MFERLLRGILQKRIPESEESAKTKYRQVGTGNVTPLSKITPVHEVSPGNQNHYIQTVFLEIAELNVFGLPNKGSIITAFRGKSLEDFPIMTENMAIGIYQPERRITGKPSIYAKFPKSERLFKLYIGEE